MTVISHNISVINAQRQFGINTKNKAKTAEKLSSGYKINRAADDAAGLSISEKMRRQIRGLTQGVENTEAGVSLCQVADGALAEVNDMLHRITELSVKSANGTNSQSDRQAIQEEINQVLQEIDRICDTTSFNERKIFVGKEGAILSTSTESSTPISVSMPTPTTISGNDTDYIDFIQDSFVMSGTPEKELGVGTKVITANDMGIAIDGDAKAWSDFKTASNDSLDLDNIVAGEYNLQYRGLTFKFEIKNGTEKEDVIEALNGASFRVSEDIVSHDAITLLSSGMNVGTKTEQLLSHGKDYYNADNARGYDILLLQVMQD